MRGILLRMKKILAFIVFLGFVSWMASGAIKTVDSQFDAVQAAANASSDTDQLYSMLPSGEKLPEKVEDIAPAAGKPDQTTPQDK